MTNEVAAIVITIELRIVEHPSFFDDNPIFRGDLPIQSRGLLINLAHGSDTM
jgi:hypothetical protein